MKDECDFERVYHCLSDGKGRKWEKCIQKTLILEGNCPMYTSDGYLDWKPCNISDLSCPKSSYVSNEVYKYPWCFGDNTPRNVTIEDGPHYVRDGPSLSLIIGIVAPIVLLVLAAAFICLIIGIRRKRRLEISRRIISNMSEEVHFLKDNIGAISGREFVRKGVHQLLKQNVFCIVVIGGIGNMVNSTARDILELYAMQKQWESKQYQFPDIPTTIDENTIVFVYGWFGLWNDDFCSLDAAKTVCDNLLRILKNTKNVKIIIGMRDDLYTMYKKELKEHSPLFHHEMILDVENLSDEYLYYFDEQKQYCRIPGCRCNEITHAMLKGGGDELIGMPLKVEVISKHHFSDVIDSYIKDNDILKAMKVHFTALEKNENPIYEWLMYICLKGHFSRTDSFDKDLVSKMNFGIHLSSFDEQYVHLRKYIRVWVSDPQHISMEDACYIFWHPFIYICAFHYLYEKDRSIVMNYCNLDAIWQLVRPSAFIKSNTLSSYIEVSADDDEVELFRKRWQKLGLQNDYKYHPLVSVQYAKKNG
ncbi:uncharacterized protein LOC144626346 isoform X2 [Crassostrea virginica]